MIPLIAAGAVSIATDVVGAWKAHAETAAMTQAAKSADFQASLKTAATKLAAAAELKKQQSLPADLKAVTQEILQAPDVQSMAHASPSATVNLSFDANGNLYAPQTGGGVRQIMVGPDVRQQLQQLNATMHSAGAGPNAGTAHVNAEIASIHLPVQVNLAAA